MNVISQEECQSQWGYGKGRVEVSLFYYCLISHLRNSKDINMEITSCAFLIRQKDIVLLNHDFYVFVGKQCRTENSYTGQQYNIF